MREKPSHLPHGPMFLDERGSNALKRLFNQQHTTQPTQPAVTHTIYPTLAKAPVGGVSALAEADFRLQRNAPGALTDSEETRTAYALSELSGNDLVVLQYFVGEASGGFWGAVKFGGGSLCFEPCDLFSVLDSLSLSTEAQATVDTMKESCGCSTACGNCPSIGRNFNLQLSGVTVTSGIDIELSNGSLGLVAEISTSQLQSIIDEIEVPVEVVTLVDAETCVWQGTQQIRRNLLVQLPGFGNVTGIPGTYEFTFTIRADFQFGDDWRVDLFVDSVEWNGDSITGSVWTVDADDEFSLNFRSDPNSATGCGETTADVIEGNLIPGAFNDPYDLTNAQVSIG